MILCYSSPHNLHVHGMSSNNVSAHTHTQTHTVSPICLIIQIFLSINKCFNRFFSCKKRRPQVVPLQSISFAIHDRNDRKTRKVNKIYFHYKSIYLKIFTMMENYHSTEFIFSYFVLLKLHSLISKYRKKKTNKNWSSFLCFEMKNACIQLTMRSARLGRSLPLLRGLSSTSFLIYCKCMKSKRTINWINWKQKRNNSC